MTIDELKESLEAIHIEIEKAAKEVGVCAEVMQTASADYAKAYHRGLEQKLSALQTLAGIERDEMRMSQ